MGCSVRSMGDLSFTQSVSRMQGAETSEFRVFDLRAPVFPPEGARKGKSKFGVQGLGFRVGGLEFGVGGLELRVEKPSQSSSRVSQHRQAFLDVAFVRGVCLRVRVLLPRAEPHR